MRLRKMSVLAAALAILAAIALPTPAPAVVEGRTVSAQSQAADAVMAQLEAADRSLALDEIDQLDGLGPMPWLSFTAERSPKAVRAWQAVAAQLPTANMAAGDVTASDFVFAESEAPEETGGNDTPETGDMIEGFGTGEDEESVVTITGHLSGAEVRPPIFGDCDSLEDDGSIDSANFTPAAEIQVALCIGEIGDGPFGETSGDTDFYSYGFVEEGTALILDVVNESGSLDPVNSIIGIYSADGTLLDSIEDTGEGDGDTFLFVPAPADGEYFGVVAGCCELQADPTDSSTGAGADETGTYEVFVVAFPPPCSSSEDDGSLALANSTVVPEEGIDFCTGVIGDGPHGAADSDFYALGFVEAEQLILADVAIFEGEPFDTVLGVYDADGNLLASAEDSGNPEEPTAIEFLTEGPGEYFVGVAGCCELPSDPTDPASGTPSEEQGFYEILVGAITPPCTSEEDDGSLALANTDINQSGDFCFGIIGDGPHGSADGDFYALGEAEAGSTIVADVLIFEGEPFRTVLGVYNSAGDLIASAEDSGNPESDDFLLVEVEATDEYFVAVVGCCELPSDPTDPASGVPSDEAGPYEVFLTVVTPPCVSTEEDGSIELANDASNVGGGEELFEIVCEGEVGDGEQAEANGDTDFFRTRVLPEGRLLIVDHFAPFPEALGASDLTIGVYNEAGDLIGSGQDDASDFGPATDFFSVLIPEEGTYYVVESGGLPTDPTDPTTGTNTDIVSPYATFVVDTTEEFIGGGAAGWGLSAESATALASRERSNAIDLSSVWDGSPQAALFAKIDERRNAVTSNDEEPVIDTDFFLIELRKGDAVAGGFDASRITGILDPSGVQRSGSQFNPSFIYPAASPLAHQRRTGFDHVATVDGVHAVFVSEGVGAYEGEIRVVRSGLASRDDDAQQIIFLDFDGADIPGDVFGTGFDATLSPLSNFLAGWGLGPADEDAVIDATIDSVVETLDTDLRVLDGRNGDRDASGVPTEFDVEILNSRDHGDRWGDPDVSRVVIGGTIDELQIATLGIAQSIDPGNTETEETAVVLLDLMSEPEGSPVSINSYGLADGVTKPEFVGFVLGHITGHEIGHFIGNWHQDTFNEIQAIMDAGGDFPAIAGVGPDGVFGSGDDTDPDFVEDVFEPFEGFEGIEDTGGRSAFGLSTGAGGDTSDGPSDLVIEIDGVAYPGDQVDLYGQFEGGLAPFTVEVNWGDGSTCPGDGTCFVDPAEDGMPSLVDADYTYAEAGVYAVEVTVTDANGNSVSASVDTAACTIIGTNRAETLNGTPGDDVICGLGGNDRIFGRDGNDTMFGGSGRDRMDGGPGNDIMFGGSEADTMSGGSGLDMMSGGKGNDIMRGGSDADVMNGRLGSDRMFGEAGTDMMLGNRGNDRMYGGADGDAMAGGRGDDRLDGQNGDDMANGGQGRDVVNGGRGNDDLSGGSGVDNLSGGLGDDDLDGGADIDRCNGGPGTNTLVACEL